MTESAAEASDEELAAQAQQGDERALGHLYDRHGDRLFSLARAMLHDDGAAEEAVTDAFLRLWKSRDYSPDRGSVGAYLVMVTRSRALDQKRSDRRRLRREEQGAVRDVDGAAIPISRAGPDPAEAAVAAERRENVQSALDALTEKQREVLQLAFFQGLSHSQISERLQKPLGTVKSRLRDGMNRLKEVYPVTARQA